MHQYVSVLVTSAQIELVQIFLLWSFSPDCWAEWSRTNIQKSTLIHKTQPRCFHCGCSVFCVSVHFISSPRPPCQSIPSGTAGTPPLWTKTRAPWPSWRAAPGDLWTACPCCSSGSMWNAKSKSWPHLNMWKVARSNRKYTVNRRKLLNNQLISDELSCIGIQHESIVNTDNSCNRRGIAALSYLRSFGICCFVAGF